MYNSNESKSLHEKMMGIMSKNVTNYSNLQQNVINVCV